jgi:hypothetical protein
MSWAETVFWCTTMVCSTALAIACILANRPR